MAAVFATENMGQPVICPTNWGFDPMFRATGTLSADLQYKDKCRALRFCGCARSPVNIGTATDGDRLPDEHLLSPSYSSGM